MGALETLHFAQGNDARGRVILIPALGGRKDLQKPNHIIRFVKKYA
jgi:hypothetical protein